MITQYSSYVIIFDDLLRLSLHGRCLSLLDRHDLLVPQSRTSIIARHRALCLCWSWARYTLFFEPFSILSDFEDKSQYYFPNVNVGISGKNLVREQFCHQLDFFGLQTAKKLQLINSAACRNWDLS